VRINCWLEDPIVNPEAAIMATSENNNKAQISIYIFFADAGSFFY